jgi:hypothetical protein
MSSLAAPDHDQQRRLLPGTAVIAVIVLSLVAWALVALVVTGLWTAVHRVLPPHIG